MNKPRVLVLMATYNGEKYLREQIDSILTQTDVDVFVKVSDDRSTDNTSKILQEYKEKYSNFDYVINQNNKGFTYNFLDLYFSIKNEKFDYCAFSDQDDFWLPEKLIKAIELIQQYPNEKGTFYCSNLTLVDENLKPFDVQEKKDVNRKQKYRFLASNIATGCTTVVDHKFYEQSIKYYPKDINLHDYWLFLIALFTAEYVYDFKSYIHYRQHTNNQIGSSKKLLTKANMQKLHKKSKKTYLFKEFLKGYESEIYPQDLKYVKAAANCYDKFGNRFKVFFSHKIRRRKHNFIFKLLVLLGKY